MTGIADNYQHALERIEAASRAAGRTGEVILLVVVTKGHPLESIQEVLEAGALDLGENYVEEGIQKIKACQGRPGLKWHMIGHVQSRKAHPAARHFDCLHSLDSLKLATRLDRFAGEMGRKLPVMLECNVTGEESKHGWDAQDEERWPALVEKIAPVLDLASLEVTGLMTMAPYAEDPERARPAFRKLRRLREFLAVRLPQGNWSQLSMGMSGDFETAIQEGATILRIGTAIMGERPRR
jgi:pyridoxal phosphate enzyme (YggS family)